MRGDGGVNRGVGVGAGRGAGAAAGVGGGSDIADTCGRGGRRLQWCSVASLYDVQKEGLCWRNCFFFFFLLTDL